MKWYYAEKNGAQIPCDETELARLAAAARIQPDTLVWNDSMPDWKEAAQVRPDWFRNGGGVAAAPAVLSNQGPSGPIAAPGMPRPAPGMPPAPVMPPAPADGLALASMICGIVSIVTLCVYIGAIPGIAAVICGHMARKRIKEGLAPPTGNGMAVAGLVTGYISIGLTLLGIVVFVGLITLGALSEVQ